MITLSGNLLVVGIILALIIYTNLMPLLDEKVTETMAELNLIPVENNTMHKKECSRDCCKHTQWPAPHQKKSESETSTSNLMCNGGTGGGCLCVDNDDVTYLSERGGNIKSCDIKNTE